MRRQRRPAICLCFYPRPPYGGRHGVQQTVKTALLVSILALHTEGDIMCLPFAMLYMSFYPRPPYGGRRAAWVRNGPLGNVSILALHTEGDPRPPSGRARTSGFYPRPPYGGRHLVKLLRWRAGLFLSSPSIRRATVMSSWLKPAFSVSILALHTEGDRYDVADALNDHWFLSSPSIRRATIYHGGGLHVKGFLSSPSIRRATREADALVVDVQFLSSPSIRRATRARRAAGRR